jgi:Big-like domain-containing protein
LLDGTSLANRTVTVTPEANQSGTATITVTVSDGALTASDTFVVAVNPINDPPAITDIASQSIVQNTSTSALGFTLADLETAAASLTVTGTSSDQTLVPDAAIAFGGSDSNRTVTVTPAANQTGTATITVTVSDGSLTSSDTFVLTVTDG